MNGARGNDVDQANLPVERARDLGEVGKDRFPNRRSIERHEDDTWHRSEP